MDPSNNMSNDDIASLYEEALAANEGGDDGESDLTGYVGADVQGVDDDDTQAPDAEDDGEAPADEDDTDTDSATVEAEDFDWAEYGTRTVEVTVQGRKVKVPLAEAINGYMRQADYTQKTQANAEAVRMAEWAQQLREAFQRDPKGTIGFLQQAYGITGETTQEADPYADVDPEFQPFVQRIRQQDQELANLKSQFEQQHVQQEQARILQEVKQEVAELTAEFGEDFDPFEVLPVARDAGLSVRDAYYLVMSQKRITQERAIIEARKQAEAKATTEAKKRELTKKATPAKSPRGTAVETQDFDTFEALLEHNLKNRNLV